MPQKQSRFASLALAVVMTACLPLHAAAQTATTAEKLQPVVTLVHLSPPVYPLLARQARISGDVRILASIRLDGSVERAEVLSGHPLLKQSAVDSALKSTFECKGRCPEGATYEMRYTFDIAEKCPDYGPHCDSVEEHLPQVAQWQDHVTLTVDPLCTCDPIGTITRLKWRSAKCLYLWHCASRVIDEK